VWVEGVRELNMFVRHRSIFPPALAFATTLMIAESAFAAEHVSGQNDGDGAQCPGPLDFSLVLGGPTLRLFRRPHLAGNGLMTFQSMSSLASCHD
jgi:hypothetical protein